jgi:hypothetical protein
VRRFGGRRGADPTARPAPNHAVAHDHRFAAASIEAAARGDRDFTLDLGHGPFTACAMRRLEKARLHVQDELRRCGAADTALRHAPPVAG